MNQIFTFWEQGCLGSPKQNVTSMGKSLENTVFKKIPRKSWKSRKAQKNLSNF